MNPHAAHCMVTSSPPAQRNISELFIKCKCGLKAASFVSVSVLSVTVMCLHCVCMSAGWQRDQTILPVNETTH